ncbi:L-threonylcarbamoyladenylate synthase [Ruminococcus sp.]|uniref:L-threonylcarbamoyladenylate synthase n=1 Tax=Ruminococcus sp. TaxID=41978 RepID=UPI0025D57DB2|nr:L-threonylcarbamoyladenylate synthase [Ruminococcus sp.]MBQ8965263.1 threonylcarbamoyl-AMP synthase [Ruminococcus sp.]
MFETKILGTDEKSVRLAAELIKSGEVVGIPTETVYGLGADAFDEAAVRKIFAAKGRPADNPLIVHVSAFDEIAPLVIEIPELAKKCAEKFWPGPLTMIMPKSNRIPLVTSGGLDTVGIRMPSNSTARAVIRESGCPIAAPSANLSGSPSPTTAQHVFADMNGRIPAIVDGGACGVGVESTVISFEGDGIRLLRPGFISVEDLKEVTENVMVDKGVLEMLGNDVKVSSPGMKYKHYAPKAEVTIVDGSSMQFNEFCKANADESDTLMVFTEADAEGLYNRKIVLGASDEEQAQHLFDALRELDVMGAEKVYARCPRKTGVGLAVYNRLLRAAAFRVIHI